MAGPVLSLNFKLRYTPQPSVVRGVAAFEKAFAVGLKRTSPPTELPATLVSEQSGYTITIDAESWDIGMTAVSRMDIFGASASSLAGHFACKSCRVSPTEAELLTHLVIPVPDAAHLGGLAACQFTWPRKLELRPEALGKDHYIPTETGIVHMRLSVTSRSKEHRLALRFSNRHDRVEATQSSIEEAYALCLRGVQSVVRGIVTPAWQRALLPIITGRLV